MLWGKAQESVGSGTNAVLPNPFPSLSSSRFPKLSTFSKAFMNIDEGSMSEYATANSVPLG